MLPDRVSNPGPLTYESGALPIALRGPAQKKKRRNFYFIGVFVYLSCTCKIRSYVGSVGSVLACRSSNSMSILAGVGKPFKKITRVPLQTSFYYHPPTVLIYLEYS